MQRYPIVENQTEKKMDNDVEVGFILQEFWGVIESKSCSVSPERGQ